MDRETHSQIAPLVMQACRKLVFYYDHDDPEHNNSIGTDKIWKVSSQVLLDWRRFRSCWRKFIQPPLALLVGGFNQFEKYQANWIHFPKDRGENNKYLKPPSLLFYYTIHPVFTFSPILRGFLNAGITWHPQKSTCCQHLTPDMSRTSAGGVFFLKPPMSNIQLWQTFDGLPRGRSRPLRSVNGEDWGFPPEPFGTWKGEPPLLRSAPPKKEPPKSGPSLKIWKTHSWI